LTLILCLFLGILERDVFALIRFENRADIRRFVYTNGCRFPVSLEVEGGQGKLTFEEGYELDKPFIARLAFPRPHYNGVFRVRCHMFRVRVNLDEYDIMLVVHSRSLFAYYDNAIEWPIEI